MSAGVWMVLAALALGQAGQPVPLLDLTAHKVERMDRSRKVGCGSGGGVFVSGGPYQPPELALHLEIVGVTTNRLEAGQTASAEVRLTNIGDKNVIVPWDPDMGVVYGKDCKGLGLAGAGRPATLVGSLMLRLIGNGGEEDSVGGHFLYARIDRSATYRILVPGQSALIRLWAKLPPSLEAHKGPALPATGAFEINATFDLTDSRLPNPYRTVVSVNSVEINGLAK